MTKTRKTIPVLHLTQNIQKPEKNSYLTQTIQKLKMF